jgi:hypothetical protein
MPEPSVFSAMIASAGSSAPVTSTQFRGQRAGWQRKLVFQGKLRLDAGGEQVGKPGQRIRDIRASVRGQWPRSLWRPLPVS